jgi:hypothetical protein
LPQRNIRRAAIGLQVQESHGDFRAKRVRQNFRIATSVAA